MHRCLVAIDYGRSAYELHAIARRTVNCHVIHYNRRSACPTVDVAAHSPSGAASEILPRLSVPNGRQVY